MQIIVAVDNNNGMMFNNRRVSQDKAVRAKIDELLQGKKLWVNEYTMTQYKDSGTALCVDNDFLSKAEAEDFCFVENVTLADVLGQIKSMILFRWNRNYPSDFKLDVLPQECGFRCMSIEEFAGNSHEKITMEIWRK